MMQKNNTHDEKTDPSIDLVQWHCKKCKIRLAVIDPLESELRLRYKDLVVVLKWSDEHCDNDQFSVLCRRCAWNNAITRKQLKNGTLEDMQKNDKQ